MNSKRTPAGRKKDSPVSFLAPTPKHPAAYAKPGAVGGSLIRNTIQFLRQQGVRLPISSHILIGVSGGIDSVALAHLLVHYGRRIIDPKQISLVHINHGWRKAESNEDEEFVKELGKRWNVPVFTFQLKPPSLKARESWEELARTERKKIFSLLAKEKKAIVFTAHQADDLAETLLWRLFTGAAETHGGGIAFRHGSELRPFLTVRKHILVSYLKEEGETFREDSTNQSPRFLRSQMRMKLMPEIERLFPRAIDHLGRLALKAQQDEAGMNSTAGVHLAKKGSEQANDAHFILLKAAGIRVRRPHLERIMESLSKNQQWQGEFHLPDGWVLSRQMGHAQDSVKERWLLERS